ncbi:hypothetical protein ABK040_003072 [Willaertia magna]
MDKKAFEQQFTEISLRHRQNISAYEKTLEDYKTTYQTLQHIPKQLSHKSMIPIGSHNLAYFPGNLIETNEITIALGEDYFIKTTSFHARQILKRRMEKVLKNLENERKLLYKLYERMGLSKHKSEYTYESNTFLEDDDEANEEAFISTIERSTIGSITTGGSKGSVGANRGSNVGSGGYRKDKKEVEEEEEGLDFSMIEEEMKEISRIEEEESKNESLLERNTRGLSRDKLYYRHETTIKDEENIEKLFDSLELEERDDDDKNAFNEEDELFLEEEGYEEGYEEGEQERKANSYYNEKEEKLFEEINKYFHKGSASTNNTTSLERTKKEEEVKKKQKQVVSEPKAFQTSIVERETKQQPIKNTINNTSSTKPLTTTKTPTTTSSIIQQQQPKQQVIQQQEQQEQPKKVSKFKQRMMENK